MTAETRAALAGVLTLAMIKAVATGDYRSVVKPTMGVPLLAAGIILGVVGVAPALLPAADGSNHASGRDRTPRVAAFVLLPVVLMSLGPKPLGADAVALRTVSTTGASFASAVPPLPSPVEGAVPLTDGDFVLRSLVSGIAFSRVRVRLVGFVAPGPDAGGFLLTRFAISCCAADAIPNQVAIRPVAGRIPPENTWVEVEGTWQPPSSGEARLPPILRPTGMRTIDPPADPYE